MNSSTPVTDELIIEQLKTVAERKDYNPFTAPKLVARNLKVKVDRVRGLVPASFASMGGSGPVPVVANVAARMLFTIAKNNEKRNPMASIKALEAWAKLSGANAPEVSVTVTSTAKTPAQVRAAMVRHFPRELQHAEPEGGNEPSTSPSGTPTH